MYKKVMAATLVLMFAGCSGLPQKIDGMWSQSDSKVAALMRDVGQTAPDMLPKAPPPVARDSGPWLNKSAVKRSEPALPPLFNEPATFERTVSSLAELAERIALRSGVPVKVSADAVAIAVQMHAPGGTQSGVGAGVPALPPMSALGAQPTGGVTMPMPANRVPVAQAPAPVTISYGGGNFKGLLDTVAARFGVSWKYANGTILFFHTDSRTFQINTIPGDSAFTASVRSGAASSGGSAAGGASSGAGTSNDGVSSQNSQNTAVTSNLSVYSSIEKSVSALLSRYGKVVSSPATGSLTVVDTPDVLDRVSEFIERENKALSRQVVINVMVLSVTLSDSDEYGINWNLVYSTLRNKFGIMNSIASSPGATALSAGILASSSSRFAGSSLLINALSEQGKVRRQTSASVVTLNNQPVPVQVATQTGYLKSSQTTLTALVGATTTLEPGTVTSGFNMSILPHLLNDGTVLLQFSTDISALRGIRSITSNGSSIETPEIDTRNFLQRVSMKSNETLIISGFEETDDKLNRQGTGRPNNFLFGGGLSASAKKEVLVVMITPTMMYGS